MLHLVVLALSLKVNIYSPVAVTIQKKKKKKPQWKFCGYRTDSTGLVLSYRGGTPFFTMIC